MTDGKRKGMSSAAARRGGGVRGIVLSWWWYWCSGSKFSTQCCDVKARERYYSSRGRSRTRYTVAKSCAQAASASRDGDVVR